MGILLSGHFSLGQGDSSDLLVYEGFDYDAGSNLEYLDGGIGWEGPWSWRALVDPNGKGSVVFGAARIEAGSLVYGNLKTEGNHLHMTGELGELQLARRFASGLNGEPGTAHFISFLGHRIGPLDDPTGDSWYPNPYPRGASVRFWREASEELSLGNFSNKPTNEWASYGSGMDYLPTGVSFSEDVALVVAKITHNEGGEALTVWINPDLSVPQDASTAHIHLADAGGLTGLNDLGWISPFAGNETTDKSGNLVRPHAEMLLDELRIGLSWEAVTPIRSLWGPFEKLEGDLVPTGSFLRNLQVSHSPWLWSGSLQTWQFLRPESIGPRGGWTWFYDQSGQVRDGSGWAGFAEDFSGVVNTGDWMGMLSVVNAPWIWSFELNTWIWMPAGQVRDGYAFGFVVDSELEPVRAPSGPVAPLPFDGDLHAPADAGAMLLSWNPGQRATSHRVFFGTDAEAVARATTDSPEFMGEVNGTSMEIETDFDSMQRYFWRVDAVNETGMASGDVWGFRPRQLAFPGAGGHGRFAVGGRFGKVVTVTNLNDSGPGSLRAAIEDFEGPRTIVFDVAGIITLETDLTLGAGDDQITIAGQTAPGKGITIRKNKLGASGVNDLIMRYIRIRLGNMTGETSDGTGLRGSDHSILDHLTVSWTMDEVFSSRDAYNITLQNTILAEALNQAGHKNYPAGSRHGFAASIGGDVGSFHHNLLAHCEGRNWSLAGGLDSSGNYKGLLDIRNNVVYNWGSRSTDGGAHLVNFVRNYYRAGPATRRHLFLDAQREMGGGRQDYFVEGNILDDPANPVGPQNQRDGITNPDGDYYFFDEPFFPSHVSSQTAREAYKQVLSDVGCNLPQADIHDERIIGEVLDRSYTFVGSASGLKGLIDDEQDAGGWEFYPELSRPAGWDVDGDGLPGWWEIIIGTDPSGVAGDMSESHADPDGDGYTRLEEYLHWMALPHFTCAIDGSLEIDLMRLSRGFTDQPQFVLDAADSGSVDLLEDGTTARFVPLNGWSGLDGFSFTVTDATGDSMTRRIAVRVLDAILWEE